MIVTSPWTTVASLNKTSCPTDKSPVVISPVPRLTCAVVASAVQMLPVLTQLLWSAAAPTDETAAARASIATALARCPDLFDRPIVLAGTAAALRCTFGAVRNAWERGEVCVLRLILISPDGGGDSAADALTTTLKLCDADPNGPAAPPISVVDARPLCAAVTGTNASAACADALGAIATAPAVNVTCPSQDDSASDENKFAPP